MQFFKIALLLSPLAMVDAIPRGCGTAVSKAGVGLTLIGDQQCQNLYFDLFSIIVGEGCYCVTFHGTDCKDGNRDTWQASLLGPTALNMGKTKKGQDSYRCSDDPSWGESWDQRFALMFPDVPRINT